MMHIKCLAEYRFAVKAQSMSAIALTGGESHWLAKISQPALWPWMALTLLQIDLWCSSSAELLRGAEVVV